MKRKKFLTGGIAAAAGIVTAVAQPPVAHSAVAAHEVAQPTPATATAAQLRTIVPNAAGAVGLTSRLVMWWQEGTTWHVALSRQSDSATAALKAALGSETVVTTHAPIRNAVKTTAITKNTPLIRVKVSKRRTADSSRFVKPQVVNPPPPGTQSFSNRLLDSSPYSGGDRIIRTYTNYQGKPFESECTAATLANLGMLTAGHCDGGTANTSWLQGYRASDGGIYYTATYGTSAKSVFAANKTDASVLKPYVALGGGGFNKTIYLDTQYIYPSRFATDHGSGTVAIDTKICSDGSFSDLTCGGTVVKTNICINAAGETANGKPITVKECGIDEATASSPLVQFGDSGGAVLAGTSVGSTATTLGIISAEGGTTNPSKDLFFSDIRSVNSTLGTTEVSG